MVQQPPAAAATDNPGSKHEISHADRGLSVDLDKKNVINYEKVDKELAQYVSEAKIEISEEKNTELRRMIDRRVLVVMIATYFLQAIDKGTMSFASIMGIVSDTKLVGQDVSLTSSLSFPPLERRLWKVANMESPTRQYNWLTTCIYITILVVEYPQNYIIARVPIAKYLSFSIIGWGTVLACTAACNSFAGLVVVRTLLGLFESACQPSFVVLSAMWYRREEQAARVTYW